MRAAGWTAMAIAGLAAPQVLAAEAPSQASLDRFADTLGYQLTMVDNGPECPAGIDGCFLSTITLTLPETLPADVPTTGLSLYFSFVNRLPLVESDIFTHRLVNGDVQKLVLKPGAALRPVEILYLDQHITKPVSHFSSGMKQRLKLGLALFSDVPLILLDEPTSNLDRKGIAWYSDLISTYQNNRTLIVCSNEPREYEFCLQKLALEDFK